MALVSRVVGALLLAGSVAIPAVAGVPATAATPPPTAMVLVLDASGSMNEADGHGSTKIKAAKSALKTIIKQLPGDVQVGLRVYGHRVPSAQKVKACRDTQLISPVRTLDRAALTAAVDTFAAKGETPIGLSLQQAAKDLPKGSRGSIVLVSDGEDSCAPPQPCAVAKQLAASGIQLTINTVGLKVDAKAKAQLTCIATSTGGTYTDVKDTAKLAVSLNQVTERAARPVTLTGTTVEGNPLPDAAPVLTAGAYLDTVRSGETLYYGVRLQVGQRAKGRFTVDGTKNADPNRFGGGRLLAVTPDGAEYASESECCHTSDTWTVTTDTTVVDPDDFRVKEPGTYYFKFNLNGYRAGVTLPVKIDITVTGPGPESTDPGASPGASPGATGPVESGVPAAAASGTPTGLAAPVQPDQPVAAPPAGRGFGLLTTVGVGLAALVMGAVGGSVTTVLVRGLRRPRPVDPYPRY